GALPDLVVTSVVAPGSAVGGTPLHVSWTVENSSIGLAAPGGWVDRIYLSTAPDPRTQGAQSFVMGELAHSDTLAPSSRYTQSLDLTLTPSAIGSYIVVITDDTNNVDPRPDNHVHELTEANNLFAAPSQVTPVPANLVVTNVVIPAVNYSGETTHIHYTVTNEGSFPVWAGTKYWKDFLWLSTDPSFIRT